MSNASNAAVEMFGELLTKVDEGNALTTPVVKEIRAFETLAHINSVVTLRAGDIMQMRSGMLHMQVGAPKRGLPVGNLTEDLLIACIKRLQDQEMVHDSAYACDENKIAIAGLTVALNALNSRSTRRQSEMGNRK